jgi:type I restriction enzyme S subunit
MSNIPKLRFKEFSGEWEEKKTIDIAPLQRGFDLPISQIQKGKYPVVFSNGILKTHFEYKAKAPGIVTGRSGTIGKVTYVTKDYWSHNTALWVTDFKENDSKFIYYFYLNFNLQRYATGSGVPTLNRNDVHVVKKYIPTSNQEQEKIANFLTKTDNLIEKLSKKDEAFKKYKKGVMQKIFKQEIRFNNDDGSEFGEWEEKKLGEISHITTGKSNREDSGLSGKYTFFDRSEDIRTSNIFLFDKEAVIIAGEGSSFPPKYFKGKFDLHQRTYAIMDFIDMDAKYLFYYLDYHKKYFLRYAVGSTVKSLRLPIFQKMPIYLPSIKEQNKIASFLSSIDNLIDENNKKLEKTIEFKKGLLQQMFV